MKRIAHLILAGMAALSLTSTLPAGVVGDWKAANTRVEAFSTDRFQPILFRGGELAMITVIGDGDTDLDIFVYDENRQSCRKGC
jgi:hypothetical protein